MPGFVSNYDEILHDHIHGACKVYPTLAAGVQITTHANARTLGDFVQIVPSDTITKPFDIHYINVAGVSGNDTYELVLYYGNDNVECGRVRVTRNSTQYNPPLIPFMSRVMPANSKISAKVASAAGGENITISVFYHTY